MEVAEGTALVAAPVKETMEGAEMGASTATATTAIKED
jgi:hypothetical protein